MLIKRLFVYILCFWISFFPVYHAHAVLPAVAVGLGSTAVRFVATEIVLDTISKGFASNDPHYKSDGKLSNSKYNSWLKGKGKYVAFVAAGIAALGWMVSGDEIVSSSGNTSPDDGGYLQGYVYGVCSSCPQSYYQSVNALASDFQIYGLIDMPNKYHKVYQDSDRWKVDYFGEHNGIPDKKLTTKYYSRYSCETLMGQSACTQDAPEKQEKPVNNTELEEDFYPWISSQQDGEQRKAFLNDDGSIPSDLQPDIEVPSPPTMPDGSPLPPVGDPLWEYADWILRGVAQQENPENDYYVPPQHWDDANYLAHNVAGGNQAITSANASGEPIVNPD
ncbi:hypothetical protein AB4391_11035, partial [Vibrio lentus]|uniref:hypothetical protein n=1 Tax=Vibrio lentus TaxID=136468 RepID=UPI0010562F1F